MASVTIDTIYLDLDDVCNTLAPYVIHKYGCPIEPTDYGQFPGEFGYAAHEVINHLTGSEYTWDVFWPNLPQSLWATVPTTDFFHWLTERCRQLVGEENVFLATTPVLSPACVAGKVEWILKFCPPWLQGQFSITTHKVNEARLGTLLIDDLTENVTSFHARKGCGILVPRPWNHLADRDPQTQIADSLKQFQFTTRGPHDYITNPYPPR